MAGAIVLGVIWPAVKSIKQTTDETYQLRAYLEKRYQQSLQAHVSRRKFKEIKEQTAEFPEYIFKVGQELALVTELENLAARLGVSQQITNSNLDKISGNSASVSVRVSGDYRALLNYIAEIDAMKYFISIDQLQIVPNYGQEKMSYNLELSMRLYASN